MILVSEKRVSPFDSTEASSAVNRAASNFLNATEKVQKIRKLIETREYDTDIAKYIPGILKLVFQGMTEDIDTKEYPAYTSYKDLENLEFQIMLNNNCYTNLNSIHICFPMKIKKQVTMTPTQTLTS